MNIFRFEYVLMAFLSWAAILAGPGSGQAQEPLKVGFVYNSPVGSAGWTFAHNAGRLAMAKALGDKVATTYIESATEGNVERILRDLANSGHKLIFTTSFGFMNPTVKVAKAFPGVKFEHATGYKLADNVGVYHARAYEARYLSGIVAGKMSKSGIAGFVASFPIPEVIRGINAFTLGMRSVNPDATVRVVWISSWFDPGKEREAAEALITHGADVISQFTDSGGPIQAAQDRGVWAIGVGSDMSGYGPRAHLTSVIYKWGGFYTDMARAVMAGTWKSQNVWGGLKRGMIGLSALNDAVPAAVRDLIAKTTREIKSGQRHPFQGPIRDQSGEIKVAAGQTMDDGALLGFNWYVNGVVGALPK